MGAETPLVAVVIPVYNGEEFLREAVDSVLAQTYTCWNLTIGNNRSTDGTLAVAVEYAARDPRIRVDTYPEFLAVDDSYNRALTLAPPAAKYIKLLGADDWLFPECLERMVAVAEAHPTIGMVSSYVLVGARVGWAGLPYPSTFVDGREVCRRRLLENLKVFGGPSASLLRADIVRSKTPFFDPMNYHGDTAAFLDLLKANDFGFVHQVLSFKRKGDASPNAAYSSRVQSYYAADVDEVTKFGPVYLTPEEHRAALSRVWRAYYAFLGRAVLELRDREFWHYHLVHVRQMGYRLSYARIALHAAYRLADVILNPLRTVQGLLRRARVLISGSSR